MAYAYRIEIGQGSGIGAEDMHDLLHERMSLEGMLLQDVSVILAGWFCSEFPARKCRRLARPLRPG